MAYAKIRPRRGTLYEWTAVNPVLAEGELVMENPETGVGTGLCRFKIGDGVRPYDELPYAFNAEEADAVHGGTVEDGKSVDLRGGTLEEWELYDPVLEKGEIVVVYDEDGNPIGIVIGDGTSNFTDLVMLSFSNDYDFGFPEEYA